jgi:hypothetical protein
MRTIKFASRLSLALAIAALVGFSSLARAEVKRVDVASRADVGASGYEKIVGTVHFAVDPTDPRNRVIADIDKAPLGSGGRVEFSADLYILRPKDARRSNGIAFIDVPNRGRKPILGGFNRGAANDPVTDADLGDGFLMRQGFTLVWVGWQFDVRRENGMMGISVPDAQEVTGIVHADFTPNSRATEQTVTDLAGYSPIDPAATDTTLTVRDGPLGRAVPIARERWQLKGNTVTLADGFEPGRTYELAYRAARLPVAGLGLAAFRDVATWIKHAPDAVARAQYTVAFGSSQSGRFLRTFMYYGFNSDERGRQVFDGIWAHIAGASRLSINERGAVPNSIAMWTATWFPFANTGERDPVSGKVEGLLDNDRARQNQPKIFYTNTAVEYWGGGRSAALVHTSPDGKSDLKLPDNVRFYFLTGTQHSPGRFPAQQALGQQKDNPVEYWWTLRALLVAMDRWVKKGTPPPASHYPRLADHSLVAASHVGFPNLQGVASPRGISPARLGEAMMPLLVPEVDEDGNERVGVRTAEVAVPVATYTGWNFRGTAAGGTDQLVALTGSSVPFAKSRADREAKHDSRKSIEERYATRDQYLALARTRCDNLVKKGFLLADDVGMVMKRMEGQWDEAAR